MISKSLFIRDYGLISAYVRKYSNPTIYHTISIILAVLPVSAFPRENWLYSRHVRQINRIFQNILVWSMPWTHCTFTRQDLNPRSCPELRYVPFNPPTSTKSQCRSNCHQTLQDKLFISTLLTCCQIFIKANVPTVKRHRRKLY